MEYRRHERVLADFPVIIQYRRAWRVRGTARNMGPGGLFVETGGVPIPANSAVQIRFTPTDHPGTEERVLDALVAHCADGGVGLMFPAAARLVSPEAQSRAVAGHH